MPLPNPSANHQEVHSRLLGDALVHQRETNIWSKNTDVNTFRGNIETKEGFSNLSKGINTGNKLATQQIDNENQARKLGEGLFSSFTGVFERMTQSLRNVKFAKMFEDIGEIDQAFYHLSEGNALRKKHFNYSIDQDEKLFSQIKKVQPLLKGSAVDLKKDEKTSKTIQELDREKLESKFSKEKKETLN